MKLPKLIANYRGDTIVEVLIAIGVLSAILGTSFAIASRSFKAGQQSQERTEALKLAEGQVERLKYTARNDPNFNITYRTSASYCFAETAPYSKTSSDCQQGTAKRYNISITSRSAPCTKAPPATGSCSGLFDTFSVEVKWDSLRGEEDTLTVNYQT